MKRKMKEYDELKAELEENKLNFVFTNPKNYKILYIRNNLQELPDFLKKKF